MMRRSPLILKKPSWSVVLICNQRGNDCYYSFQRSSLKKKKKTVFSYLRSHFNLKKKKNVNKKLFKDTVKLLE